jgi:beta-galactosidase GanA
MKAFEPPYLGAAYYPEDWPLEQIDEDIALMKSAGLNAARIGEFAWSRMEPEEGHYDFDWLHLVVERLGQAGIAVIMGTPTATPPIWLTGRYPEVLTISDAGVPAQHGGRRHACPNSPAYRRHVERIVTQLAREFGPSDYVIGWQIDNELYPYGARGCCCSECHRGFQEAMRRRYGTIETLNEAWGANLWSQTYQSFAQLPVPRSDTWHHPSLLTAWMQVQSDSYAEFVEFQADILHELVEQPVGTDMMPVQGLSYHSVHRKLDVVQFNHYNSPENLYQAAFWMDLCRPIKDTPWWNTETSTCWPGNVIASGCRPSGFCRANTWMAYALGAEANLYWLWREHWSGQELMHGAVVSSAGRPLHVLGEVQEISKGLTAAGDFLSSTRPTPTGLALHCSSFAWHLFQFQPMVEKLAYGAVLADRYYQPMIRAQLRPDVIDPAADLSGYRMICSPLLPSLEEAQLIDRLREWIEAGGTWIAGPLTDIRTLDAAKYTHAPFGHLEELVGVRGVFHVPGLPRDFGLRWGDGTESKGSLWYDSFEPAGAEALATYTEGPMEGLAAVAHRRLGKGQIILLGTLPGPQDLQRLLREAVEQSGVASAATASQNVLVVPRGGPGGQGLVAVELYNQPGSVRLDRPAMDLLSGRRCSQDVEMEPYGVRVLRFQ